jgi:Zn-finger protein
LNTKQSVLLICFVSNYSSRVSEDKLYSFEKKKGRYHWACRKCFDLLLIKIITEIIHTTNIEYNLHHDIVRVALLASKFD